MTSAAAERRAAVKFEIEGYINKTAEPMLGGVSDAALHMKWGRAM